MITGKVVGWEMRYAIYIIGLYRVSIVQLCSISMNMMSLPVFVQLALTVDFSFLWCTYPWLFIERWIKNSSYGTVCHFHWNCGTADVSPSGRARPMACNLFCKQEVCGLRIRQWRPPPHPSEHSLIEGYYDFKIFVTLTFSTCKYYK